METFPVGGYCDPKFKKIESIFSEAIQTGHELGASLAIEHEGEMVVNLFGGHKDEKREKTWEQKTWVNVFSVTKAVTATCIAKLIDEGKLDFNEKVVTYWPEYGNNGKENTKVSDFLCHRAGMFGFSKGIPITNWTKFEHFSKALEQQKPIREPGSSQGYHALTYGWLVGEIVKRIDGRSVGKYFEEEIATPFGIDFKIGLDQEDFSNCADMIMMEREGPQSFPLERIKYIPSFLLPRQLKNLKNAIIDGDFHWAFQSIAQGAGLTGVNDPEWRCAEIPSANGHGNAEGLAKLYGILSSGGSRDNKKIISPETLDIITTQISNGPDTVLMGGDVAFGLGYMLYNKTARVEESPRHTKGYFGHAGIGGAVAYGDKGKNLGFAFVCNKEHKIQELYKTSNQISEALHSII